MSYRRGWVRLAVFVAGLCVLASGAPRPVLAADSSWNVDGGGNWTDAPKWTSGVPNAIGDTARLNYNITASRTVTLTGSATVGSIFLSDTTHGYTLTGTGLNMDVAGGSALIQADGAPGVVHTISGPVALYDPTTVAVNSGELVLSGVTTGGVSGRNLTKTGTGMLRLTAVYNFKSALDINQGVLRIETGSGLGSASTITVAGGAVLDCHSTDYMDAGFSVGKLNLQASSILRSSGDYVNWNSSIALQGDAAFDIVSDTLTVLRSISGTGCLTKTGTGLLNLDANSYSGPTRVEAGVLLLGHSTSLGASPSVTVASGGSLRLSGNVTISGKALILNGMGASASAALYNTYDENTWAGPVTLASASNIGVRYETLKVAGVISGPGDLTKSDLARLLLTGSNTYTGATIISRGTLEARDGVGLPVVSNLQLAGGVLQVPGPATFTRSLGTGSGQLRWTGNGGFSASGGKVIVNLGGHPTPTPLVWGSTPHFVSSGELVLGTSDNRGKATSDSEIRFVNPINLGGASRTVFVVDNRSTGADFATLSGVLSNGGLRKSGNGSLALTATNTYTGTTEIVAGAVRAADGIGLPTASPLFLNGGVWESDGPATFSRSLGTGSGLVQFKNGGFSAHGGKLTVNLGGAAAPLVVGSGGVPSALAFGSATANSETEFVHALNLNAKTAILTVNDNPSVDGDFATLSGVCSNGAITKRGLGTLALTAHNTYAGATTLTDGALRATDGIGLPMAGNLCLGGSAGVLESEGAATFTRTLGSGAGQVRWNNSGGFSAHSGKMTVALGGTASPTPLTLGAAHFVSSSGTLAFGSGTADSETEFRNNIDIAGDEMTVSVRDNPATGADFATLSGVLSNGSVFKVGAGTLALTGANTYSGYPGYTTIADGVLYAIDGVGLPTNSRLIIGTPLYTSGSPVFESNGFFTRSEGNQPGQVSWTSYDGGFAARGGKLTVAIGGTASPTNLSVSSGPPNRPHVVLIFNSGTADSEVEVRNNIDFSYLEAPIYVNDNPSTASDFATLSGRISGDVTGPTKDGPGTIRLTGANDYKGPTTIVAGALRAADGVGLPIVSNLALAGGVLEGAGATTFTRSLATSGNSKVQWTGSGGFSANGGKMTVALGGTASPTLLTWGNGYFVPAGSKLIFGSVTADSETEFKNSIDLAGATQTILVTDNPYSAGDFATLSGTLSNGGLTKDGDGLLVIKGNHTYTGATTVAAGTLKLASGAVLASTTVDVAAGAAFRGGGTLLGRLAVSGTAAPGESPGILSVGSAAFASGGALEIELGGTARGTQYDVLDADGAIALQAGSRLNVLLYGGFTPAPGDTFDVLDFPSLTGTFTTVNLPALASGRTWNLDRLYADGVLEVVPEPATLALVALGALAVIRRRRGQGR